MVSLRNVLFASCVITTLFVGFSPTPAGATPAPLNSIFLEINTPNSNTTFTANIDGTSVSQSGGTVTITAGTVSNQNQFIIHLTAPGNQQLAAGTEYDSSNGASISVQNQSFSRPATGGCGNSVGDQASAFVDQAAYDGSGQPTTLGVEFDVLCNNGDEYFGTAAYNLLPSSVGQGYYMFENDGTLTAFGNDAYLNYLGDLSSVSLNQPIVGMAITPDGGGYWMVATDGGIFAFGDAQFYGSTGAIRLNKPIVGMAATPDGHGYWLVASDGGIFAFGDAQFHGSTGAIHLNMPIVGMAPIPGGTGYWLVASDGGIFAFGTAPFLGSTGAIRLNEPIVGMAPTPSGMGYWLTASDGGVFSFGDAPFFGSVPARLQPGQRLNSPIIGMTPTQDGGGYWFAAADGGVFTFGDAQFAGSLGGLGLNDVAGLTH